MWDKIKRIAKSINRLPDKKRYVEFITAILSVPVLLSVILLNYTNLQNQRNPKTETNTPTPAIITIIQDRTNRSGSSDNTNTETTKQSDNTQCKAEVGPVSIVSPETGETTSDNPLSIVINQNDPKDQYCAIVWSYRINGSPWSNFDDRDISIYNMESGDKTLEIRFKSLVSGDEETLTRNFYYKNTQQVPTPTTAPTATSQPTNSPSPSPTIQTVPNN